VFDLFRLKHPFLLYKHLEDTAIVLLLVQINKPAFHCLGLAKQDRASMVVASKGFLKVQLF
jgi:hypothetical protein